jgi:hypothetical protein
VTVPALVAAAAILVLALLSVTPRLLLRRSQDRLARTLLAEEGGALKLLTRAELVAGVYRRIPGVLGLTEGVLRFQGLFGETELLPTSRIQKIVTGKRLANGRRLVRLEVLRVTRTGGGDLEFVLAPASATAWRSHLGLWAMRERTTTADTVAPGRG